MWIFVVILVVFLALLFGLSSISQSYAAARQAQAVIETARVAQLASAGNLVLIAILVVLVLAALGATGYLLARVRQSPSQTGQWLPGPNARWGQPDMNAMLPILLVMMMYQQLSQAGACLPTTQFAGTLPVNDDDVEDEIPWDM